MRLFLLFCLTLLLHYQGVCGDYSQWWWQSPGGNEVCYESWGQEWILAIKCKEEPVKTDGYGFVIAYLKRFYFYKNHIVGEFRQDSALHYFVFNETDCGVLVFTEKDVFKQHLKKAGLIPIIWTRWYDENAVEPNFLIGYEMMVLLPLFGILLIFSLIVLIASRFKVPAINWFFTLIFLLIVGKIILNNVPGSI